MTTHSDKALMTLKLMNAGTMKLTTIRYVEEMRMVPAQVTCPTCLGHKSVLPLADGSLKAAPQTTDAEFADGASYNYGKWSTATQEFEKAVRAQRGPNRDPYGMNHNCPTCKVTNRRARMFGYCTGTVEGTKLAPVMVGYPVFPEGSEFSSRFAGTSAHCHLCNKLVPSRRFVPVDDGSASAMWVGEDCARKILSVKSPIKADGSVIIEGK